MNNHSYEIEKSKCVIIKKKIKSSESMKKIKIKEKTQTNKKTYKRKIKKNKLCGFTFTKEYK